MLVEEDYEPLSSLTELDEYLARKKTRIGDCSNNALVIELKLITAYNRLCELEENPDNLSEEVINDEIERFYRKLIALQGRELSNLKCDNAFSDYLNFLANYSIAKLVEVKFRHSLTSWQDSEVLALDELQRSFLRQAKVNFISFTKRSGGEHYAYGFDILRKLPSQDHEIILQYLEFEKLETKVPLISQVAT